MGINFDDRCNIAFVFSISANQTNYNVSKQLNFRFKWKFTPQANGLTPLIIESPLFVTNHNDVSYKWQLQVRGDAVQEAGAQQLSIKNMPIFLHYISGPKAEVECTSMYRIIENASIFESKMNSHKFVANGDGQILNVGNAAAALQLAAQNNARIMPVIRNNRSYLNRQYQQTSGQLLSSSSCERQDQTRIDVRQKIEINVNLYISDHLFDPFSLLPPILPSPNRSDITEKMLDRVLSGKQCIGNVKLVCDGGEFYIDPNFFVAASDYFETMFEFNYAAKNDENIIKFVYIPKSRMMIVS